MTTSQEIRRLPSKEHEIYGWQDDCLIAIEDGNPLPTRRLLLLPPWRAVMVARVAQKAGVPLEQGTVEQMIAEAVEVGGDGTLGEWWNRT